MSQKTIYVKIDKHDKIQETLEVLRDRIIDLENKLKEIEKIKSQEDVQLSSWRDSIEKTMTRIDNINSFINTH